MTNTSTSHRPRITASLLAGVLVLSLGATAQAGGQSATGVAVGGDQSCAISSDTTAWCWGNDSTGQLGDGTTGGADHVSLTPLQVQTGSGPLSGVKAIATGEGHSCALKTSGTVWCWGSDSFGQIGDGTTGDASHLRLKPAEVKKGTGHLTGVTAISATSYHTCAVTADKTVWCWGSDDFGQLGDGTIGNSSGARLLPVHVRNGTGSGSLSSVKAVSTGERFSCAVKTTGTVWCWGEARFGEAGDGTTGDSNQLRLLPVEVKKGAGHISTATAVTSAGFHSCARLQDKTVWCWGHGAEGELGDGTTGDSTLSRYKAVQVLRGSGTLGQVTAVTAGGHDTCALRNDGTAWCWGGDVLGTVGDGTTGDASTHRLKATQVVTHHGALVDVSALAVGERHACALLADATVWCWGSDWAGQVGDGTTGGTDMAVLKAVKAHLLF